MGLKSWVSFRKVARIVVLVTTLAAACTSKSEQFVNLVQPKDRAKAAEIIKDKKKEQEWKRALAALEDLRFEIQSLPYQRDHWRKNDHWGIIKFLAEYLEGFNLRTTRANIVRDLRTLRQIGLAETSAQLEAGAKEGFEALDKIAAEKISLSEKGWYDELKKYYAKEPYMWEQAIRELQRILRVAKKAGFTETDKAATHSLINLRGAINKLQKEK